MFRFALANAFIGAAAAQDEHPHLAQAWQALSTGDGMPGQVGFESYIYEDCPGKYGTEYTETCMSGHVWDYGADNCVKYEVNMGVHSKYSGTYYVKCDAVNCCKDARIQGPPDVKKWDIGQAKKSVISHMEATDLDDLDGHVTGADTWLEDISALSAHVKYTYYIHQAENGDIISHAIDYEAPTVAPGRILYGNFTVKHLEELDAFRQVFKAPDACLANNVLHCNDEAMEKWDAKFQGRSTVASSSSKRSSNGCSLDCFQCCVLTCGSKNPGPCRAECDLKCQKPPAPPPAPTPAECADACEKDCPSSSFQSYDDCLTCTRQSSECGGNCKPKQRQAFCGEEASAFFAV